MTREICDIKTLAKYLDVSVPFIRKLVRAKSIPCFRIGNRLKFDLREIDKWIELHREEERKSILFL